MAKVKSTAPRTSPSGSSTAKPEDPQTQPSRKKKKKSKNKKKMLFWKKNSKPGEKKTPEGSKLPPKTLQEVSANWKALQELLKQKAAILNSSAPNTSPKKRNGTRTGGIVPQVNGTGTVPATKPMEKAKKIRADLPAQPGRTKGENNMDRKNISLGQEDGKKHKRGRKRGSAGREHGTVRRKWQKTEEPADPQAADIWFDDVDPDDIEAALGPEAAEVARRNLGIQEERRERLPDQVLVKESAFGGLTKAVAVDCEMVGVGAAGEESIVARVSIVNLFGKCIYDKYVKPTEKVTDYRTAVSGIRPEHLKAGEDFKVVQKEVAGILKGRILVGHALHNDLKILFLDHPKKKIRDTQRYKPFKQQVKSGRPSLQLLCEKLLNVTVQASEHSSVQDAQAAMRLYTMVKRDWEASLKAKFKAKKE